MAPLIDDRDEAVRVLGTLIERANLPELVGPVRPDAESVDLLLLAHEDEEAEVELVDEHGEEVAILYVDVCSDRRDGWTIGLRGWRLSADVASV